MALMHGTCVVVSGAGVLIRGASGSGKSDLALRLIDDGAILVSDDYCNIAVRDGVLIAETPDKLAGLIEVRGFGAVRTPYIDRTDVRLVIDLTPMAEIERIPERYTTEIEGAEISWIKLDPSLPSAVARIKVILNYLHNGWHTAPDLPAVS